MKRSRESSLSDMLLTALVAVVLITLTILA